ncbi:MAG: hypothetical protein JJ863_37385 [Deltaproteobacteria bacterium]|nr:hypothetical protein [Deltaproteobacteria bacterium]
MRIGLIGPAEDAKPSLREAAEFLLGDAEVDQAIYLGDDATLVEMTKEWAHDLANGDGRDFLSRAVSVAVDGSPDQIEDFLEADAQIRRISRLRTLPPAPSRAVEMVGDRIVLVVHDKKVLDEEDIANAAVIVYGQSKEALLKQFGHRYFFTPGPLREGRVGMLELDDEGRIVALTFEPSGKPVWREVLQGRGAKLTVSG